MARLKRKRGERDHLTKKKGSDNWMVRFQYTPGQWEAAKLLLGTEIPREWMQSLGTPDRMEADERAGKFIRAHNRIILLDRMMRDHGGKMGDIECLWDMKPGNRTMEADGTIIVATDDQILTFKPGAISADIRPNTMRWSAKYTDEVKATAEFKQVARDHNEKRKRTILDIDQAMIDRYFDGRFGKKDEVTGKRQKDDKGDIGLVQAALDKWRAFSGGKLLRDASRLEVANFIKGEIDSRATPERPLDGLERVKKMVKLLISAINADRKDPVNTIFPTYNPFADPDWTIYDKNYVPKAKPVPFTEEDVRTIKRHAETFTREEFIMVALHTATSVRPSALYSVVRDEWVEEDEYDDNAKLVAQHRIRCMFVENDKDPHYGKRRLPIPQCIQDAKWIDGTPLLPASITGPLFNTPIADLSRDINDKLRRIGVATDKPLKRLYSARHPARQRLNACKDTNVRRYIMGHAHERRDAHDQYGGYRAHELKPWIDTIRF